MISSSESLNDLIGSKEYLSIWGWVLGCAIKDLWGLCTKKSCWGLKIWAHSYFGGSCFLLHTTYKFVFHPFSQTCIVIFMADFLYQYVHGVGEYSIILGTDYNITCKIGCARFWSLHIRKVRQAKSFRTGQQYST